MTINIRYTHTFEKQLKRYKKKFASITNDLNTFLENLEKQPSVDLGGGFSKYRIAVKSKNTVKSGGFRIVTLEVLVSEAEKEATLITIFDKSETDNVPMNALKDILGKDEIN